MDSYPKAIVWDLDGTLVDSAPDLADSLNRLLHEQGHCGLDEDQVRDMIGNGVEKLLVRGLAAVGESVDRDELAVLVRRFLLIYSVSATERTRLYGGVREVLRHFQNAGIQQAVCTNKPEEISNRILSDLSIADVFSVVVGGDTTATKKPDPMPLRACLTALDVRPQDCLMIGDSRVDVDTARALDMSVGIVSFGYARDPVEKLGADFVIDEFPSLPASLSGLRKTG